MSGLTEHAIYSKYGQKESLNAPDGFSDYISDTHVLCRNNEGIPTAIYGGSTWDFNPYRLSERRISIIDFDKVFIESVDDIESYVVEMKFILYHLIYSVHKGGSTAKLGCLSASVLYQNFRILSRVAAFGYLQRSNDIVREMSIKDCLESPVYMNAFLRTKENDNGNTRKQVSALLSNLSNIGYSRLGFTPCSKKDLQLTRRENIQHPVIPIKIYLSILTEDTKLIDRIHPYTLQISKFITEFKNPLFGNSIPSQVIIKRQKGLKHLPLALDGESALERFGISDIFQGPLNANSRTMFIKAIIRLQYILKRTIALFTGMRNQEIDRLYIGCLRTEELNNPVLNSLNEEIEPARMIKVVSSTTKFTGYRKTASWLAPNEVIKAIEIAECIAKPLAALYGRDESKCSIFPSPYIIRRKNYKYNTTKANQSECFEVFATNDMRITEQDLSELKSSSPDKDFIRDKDFSLGKYWPLKLHQFRRSLAFYASNSGLVNISTLSKQFKHTSMKMTQYYRKNFEGLKTIFGTYDPQKDEFVIPKSHPALEFQMAVPIGISNQFISDILNEQTEYYGGGGKYLQKQRDRIKSGSIEIAQFRKETIASFKEGKISYRETLLGACTKVGPCDDLLMGDMTKCLSCDGAIIKGDKLKHMLYESKQELSKYEDDTAENEILTAEINELEKYQALYKVKTDE